MKWEVVMKKFTKKRFLESISKKIYNNKKRSSSQKKLEKRGRNKTRELEFGKMTIREIGIQKIEFRKNRFRKNGRLKN